MIYGIIPARLESTRLPKECCAAMQQQFAAAEQDRWHNGFWVQDDRVMLSVDGEWDCESPLLFCPFCGHRYGFDCERVRYGSSPGVS